MTILILKMTLLKKFKNNFHGNVNYEDGGNDEGYNDGCSCDYGDVDSKPNVQDNMILVQPSHYYKRTNFATLSGMFE